MMWPYSVPVFLIKPPTCKADRTLEGASHPFEAVLYQVALEFGRRVEGLAAEFALVVQSFICEGKCINRKGETHQNFNRLVN